MFVLSSVKPQMCDTWFYVVGLNVVEVAHDYQVQVRNVVDELGLINSYDMWHGKYKAQT